MAWTREVGGATIQFEHLRVGYNHTWYTARLLSGEWPVSASEIVAATADAPFGGYVEATGDPAERRVKVYGCD